MTQGVIAACSLDVASISGDRRAVLAVPVNCSAPDFREEFKVLFRKIPGNSPDSKSCDGESRDSSSDGTRQDSADSGDQFCSDEGAIQQGAAGGNGGDDRKPWRGWPGSRQFFVLYQANEIALLVELLRMLMAADVPLNLIKDEQGRNLLHLASRDGYLPLVQLLVQNIPINDEDNWGYTPLHYASAGNNFAIAVTLLLHQANVNACPDGTINTPANLARTQEMLDFIRCLGGEGPNCPGGNWHPGPHW
jgi:hypothetical protein